MNLGKMSAPLPAERLERMREMFAKEGGILAEDYAHFTGLMRPDAPIARNKAPRRSETPSARPSRARS